MRYLHALQAKSIGKWEKKWSTTEQHSMQVWRPPSTLKYIWADTSKPKSFTYIYQKDRVIQVLFWSNLRFLSARLLLVESPHCFLLCGPMLVFSAPVTFGLGLLMGWLALWITLSGLTTMPVRSNELCCIVFPVWEARIVTWVKNTSHFIIWLFLNYHIKV